MELPIIGQPKINDWTLSVVITCSCGQTFLWSGKPQQTTAQCHCKRLYTVMTWPEPRVIPHPITREPMWGGELDIRLGMREGK